jgi:hypothetical protein
MDTKHIPVSELDSYHASVQPYYSGRPWNAEERSMVENHLSSCEYCQYRFEAVGRFIRLLRSGAIRNFTDR